MSTDSAVDAQLRLTLGTTDLQRWEDRVRDAATSRFPFVHKDRRRPPGAALIVTELYGGTASEKIGDTEYTSIAREGSVAAKTQQAGSKLLAVDTATWKELTQWADQQQAAIAWLKSTCLDKDLANGLATGVHTFEAAIEAIKARFWDDTTAAILPVSILCTRLDMTDEDELGSFITEFKSNIARLDSVSEDSGPVVTPILKCLFLLKESDRPPSLPDDAKCS